MDLASPIKSAMPAGGAAPGLAGPPRLGPPTAPTDVPNFGRINPKSSESSYEPRSNLRLHCAESS